MPSVDTELLDRLNNEEDDYRLLKRTKTISSRYPNHSLTNNRPQARPAAKKASNYYGMAPSPVIPDKRSTAVGRNPLVRREEMPPPQLRQHSSEDTTNDEELPSPTNHSTRRLQKQREDSDASQHSDILSKKHLQNSVVLLTHVRLLHTGNLTKTKESQEKTLETFLRKAGNLQRIPLMETMMKELLAASKNNTRILEALQSEYTFKKAKDADKAAKIIENLPLENNDDVKKYLGESMFRYILMSKQRDI